VSEPEELYTVDEAALQLKLHPKTVLRCIRTGRLRAQRIGKAYRIRRADLELFAGVPEKPERAIERVAVTCIVDVESVSPALAQSLARQIPAALQSKPKTAAPVRADVVYAPDSAQLKVILQGAPAETADLLMLLRVWLAQH
jgi:excisionase family DNA binding protein